MAFAAVLLAGLPVFAQNRTVSGTVKDSSGEPVPGAAVMVKGNTSIGTSTDAEGLYTLPGVPNGATLIFSFIGMDTQEVAAGNRTKVDVVLNVGYFRDGAWEELCDEIYELKQAVGERPLKVILETGLLKSAANIRRASILSMYSGADFIKTSTGKGYPGASLEAAYVMCRCIKEFYEKTGQVVGFKASGGIRSTEDAVKYYTIVKEVLGEQWLTNERFRIGASSLANALFQSFTGSEVKPF